MTTQGPRRRGLRSLVHWTLLPVLLFVLLPALYWDLVIGFPSLVLMRFPWPLLALIAGCALVPLRGIVREPDPDPITRFLAVSLAVSVLVTAVPWNGRKLFVYRLYRIHDGMTVDEVEDVMSGYAKGRGAKWNLSGTTYEPPAYPTGAARLMASGTMTYRWNEHDGAFDSDWGNVTFASGRVVRVEFVPD